MWPRRSLQGNRGAGCSPDSPRRRRAVEVGAHRDRRSAHRACRCGCPPEAPCCVPSHPVWSGRGQPRREPRRTTQRAITKRRALIEQASTDLEQAGATDRARRLRRAVDGDYPRPDLRRHARPVRFPTVSAPWCVKISRPERETPPALVAATRSSPGVTSFRGQPTKQRNTARGRTRWVRPLAVPGPPAPLRPGGGAHAPAVSRSARPGVAGRPRAPVRGSPGGGVRLRPLTFVLQHPGTRSA